MRSSVQQSLAGVALLTATFAPPLAADVATVGQETRVNRSSEFAQKNAQAAFAPSGASLVVWENTQKGIYAAYHGPNGEAVGGEMQLLPSQELASVPGEGFVISRRHPAVGFLPDGEFLIAWTEESAFVRAVPFREERTVFGVDVYVQRFAANGQPAGGRFLVHTSSAGFQSQPRIAIRPAGSALVVWESNSGPDEGAPNGIYARRLNRRGVPFGDQITVSTSPTALHPAIAVNSANRFLIAWDEISGVEEENVRAQAFTGDGRPLGAPFVVHADARGRQRWPAVSAGARGDGFLVAWQGYLSDRARARIRGQFLDSFGGLVGGDFAISRDEGTAHLAPALAPTPSGGFVAAWMAWNDAGLGLTGIELDGAGSRVGAEFWANERVIQRNYRTSLATNRRGGYLLPWDTTEGRTPVIGARRLAVQ